MSAVSGALVAAAIALLLSGAASGSGVVAVTAAGTRSSNPSNFSTTVRLSIMAGTVAAGAFLLAFTSGSVLALGLVLLAAGAGFGRLWARGRERKLTQGRSARVLEVCELLAGELRAGQPPQVALARCAALWPALDPVATAARLGADVPTALRRLSAVPGAGGLDELAGAWQVSQGSGSGLVVAVNQVTASVRASHGTRRLITSELASAQATARLVAALPLVVLVLGSGTGGDPWQFLLHTRAGLVCLGTGLGFAFVGLEWIDRIAVAVERQ